MDVYSLTRKQRPSHLTLGQSSRSQSETDSAFEVSVSPSFNYIFDEVTGSPTRAHWKVAESKRKRGKSTNSLYRKTQNRVIAS